MGAKQSSSRIAAWASLLLGSALLASAGAAIGVLLATSRGRPKPFLDEDGRLLPGGISEKVFVEINGLRQGMFIKGRDVRNPVLLYLHGGIPDLFLTEKYPTGLENLFTVVWWEQRGAGMSYRAELPNASLTLDQFVSDTIAVTNYLRERFGPDRIFLMGHSGGSFVGIHAVARAPALYRAFIGVAQMTNQLRSELLAYDYMFAEFKRRGDRAMVRRLEAAPVTLAGGTPRAYLAIRDMAMHRLGIGTMHDMRSIVTGLILPSLTFAEYTLSEKIGLWRAKARSGVSVLWREALATDLATAVPELAVPAYFLHGVHDYTCSYALAKEYVAALRAPVKGFYTFEHSAHSPPFEEPSRTRQILHTDVLTGGISLADSQDSMSTGRWHAAPPLRGCSRQVERV
jgi:pimeloyl-ACP methyl ester carboxylesterase